MKESLSSKTKLSDLERWMYERDGSRKWYAAAWADRQTFHAPDKFYVPIELLEAALKFLRRAKYFTPQTDAGGPSLTVEIEKFLATFEAAPADETIAEQP
jgi:hypothetical protein